MIVLEDKSGREFQTKYLVGKGGLSAGWRGFSISHKLLAGDVVVFHRVTPSKFKVTDGTFMGCLYGSFVLLQVPHPEGFG